MKWNKTLERTVLGVAKITAGAMVCFSLILYCATTALAVNPEIRIDETKTLLEDSSTDGEGYLVVDASTPEGFEGTLCVELHKKLSFGKVTIEITPADFYIGGQYLEPGTYTVKKAYALNDETVAVETDREEVEVFTDGDSHLRLIVTSDPAAEEAWLAMMETYTFPKLPTEEIVEESQTVAITDETFEVVVTEETGHPQQEELPDPSPSIWRTVLGLLKSLALTALFGGAVYLLVEKFRK